MEIYPRFAKPCGSHQQGPTKFFAAYKQISLIGSVPIVVRLELVTTTLASTNTDFLPKWLNELVTDCSSEASVKPYPGPSENLRVCRPAKRLPSSIYSFWAAAPIGDEVL